jgi:hypothetical protein
VQLTPADLVRKPVGRLRRDEGAVELVVGTSGRAVDGDAATVGAGFQLVRFVGFHGSRTDIKFDNIHLDKDCGGYPLATISNAQTPAAPDFLRRSPVASTMIV